VNKLTEQLPEIISAAAQSYLGILALLSVVLSVLAYFFFAGASEKVKVGIFVLLFLGVVCFGAAMFRAAPKTTEAAQPRPPTDTPSQPASSPVPSVSTEKNNPPATTNIGVEIHGEKPVVRKTEVQVNKGTGVQFGRDSIGAVLEGSKVTVGTEQVDKSIEKGEIKGGGEQKELNKNEESPSRSDPKDTNKRSSTTEDLGVVINGQTPVVSNNTVVGGGIENHAFGAFIKNNAISTGGGGGAALYDLGQATVISNNVAISPDRLRERESPYFEGCEKPSGSMEGKIEARERPRTYRELSTDELSKKGVTMAGALRGLASEMKRGEKLTWWPKQDFQKRYESHYKSDVLLLRAEMLRRLPERSCLSQEMRSLYLTFNPVVAQQVEEFASMLEKLAKLLPNSLSND
jgi:hypothetical protein